MIEYAGWFSHCYYVDNCHDWILPWGEVVLRNMNETKILDRTIVSLRNIGKTEILDL